MLDFITNFYLKGWRHFSSWLIISILILNYVIIPIIIIQGNQVNYRLTDIEAEILLVALVSLSVIRQFDKHKGTTTNNFR